MLTDSSTVGFIVFLGVALGVTGLLFFAPSVEFRRRFLPWYFSLGTAAGIFLIYSLGFRDSDLVVMALVAVVLSFIQYRRVRLCQTCGRMHWGGTTLHFLPVTCPGCKDLHAADTKQRFQGQRDDSSG